MGLENKNNSIHAEHKKDNTSEILAIGKPAIDFTAAAVLPNNKIEPAFNLRSYLNKRKGILLFYPLDFTFVCPTELISYSNHFSEFENRNTRIIAISVDSQFSHLAWRNTEASKGGVGQIQIPMVSDLKKDISRKYNVLNDDGIALRGVFLIDENFILRHFLVNDLPLGRDASETLRIIDALDHYNEHGEVCPAGWSKGKVAMHASKEGVEDYLTSHAEKL